MRKYRYPTIHSHTHPNKYKKKYTNISGGATGAQIKRNEGKQYSHMDEMGYERTSSRDLRFPADGRKMPQL